MKIQLDCIACFLRQALQAGRFVADEELIHEQILKEVMKILLSSTWDIDTSYIDSRIQTIIKELTNNSDPYYNVKKKYNKIAMDMYPYLEKTVNEANDPLYIATKLAIAGNIIDFGAKERFDLKKTILTVLEAPLAINHYRNFQKKIATTSSLVYLADNSGEIVFDKLLLETILKDYDVNYITFVVKGTPVLNDAMLEDAQDIGLDEISQIDFYELGVSNLVKGSREINSEFLPILKSNDMVISKGQANFENFSDQDYIFFLLMVKCPVIAKHLSVSMASTVLLGPSV